MRTLTETLALKAALNLGGDSGIDRMLSEDSSYYRMTDGKIFAVHGWSTIASSVPEGATPLPFDQVMKEFGIRNLCAKLPEALCDRLDNLCGFLDISKRDFIEAAIVDACKAAELVLRAENILPGQGGSE